MTYGVIINLLTINPNVINKVNIELLVSRINKIFSYFGTHLYHRFNNNNLGKTNINKVRWNHKMTTKSNTKPPKTYSSSKTAKSSTTCSQYRTGLFCPFTLPISMTPNQTSVSTNTNSLSINLGVWISRKKTIMILRSYCLCWL